jgi:hypothetical protein
MGCTTSWSTTRRRPQRPPERAGSGRGVPPRDPRCRSYTGAAPASSGYSGGSSTHPHGRAHVDAARRARRPAPSGGVWRNPSPPCTSAHTPRRAAPHGGSGGHRSNAAMARSICAAARTCGRGSSRPGEGRGAGGRGAARAHPVRGRRAARRTERCGRQRSAPGCASASCGPCAGRRWGRRGPGHPPAIWTGPMFGPRGGNRRATDLIRRAMLFSPADAVRRPGGRSAATPRLPLRHLS